VADVARPGVRGRHVSPGMSDERQRASLGRRRSSSPPSLPMTRRKPPARRLSSFSARSASDLRATRL
jgi:hypothetical protein